MILAAMGGFLVMFARPVQCSIAVAVLDSCGP